jgi:hypothetical protein
MLVVHRDSTQPASEGQYWVELVEDVGMQHKKYPSRLGYWCDREHLRHMVHVLLQHFQYELVEALISGEPLASVPPSAAPSSAPRPVAHQPCECDPPRHGSAADCPPF